MLHSLGLALPLGVRAAVPLGATALLPPKDAIDAARTMALQMLEDGLRQFNMTGRRLVPAGIPEDDILEEAARQPAELVVVGSRGWTGLTRIALGSVAETVVRHASCSVLVARVAHEQAAGSRPAE